MIAYDLPTVQMDDGPAWIRTSRLAGAGAPCYASKGAPTSWQFTMRNEGGCRAFLPGFDASKCRPPIETVDGLICHLPLELPAIGTRGRTDIKGREIIPVQLVGGVVIGVPNAAEAPRAVVFTPDGGGYAGTVEQWSRDAWALYLSREVTQDDDGRKVVAIMAPDAQIFQTIAGVLLRAYAVTSEWLSEYQMVSTADFIGILHAMWGLDPKAAPGVANLSQCTPPGLCQICRSALLSSTASPTG